MGRKTVVDCQRNTNRDARTTPYARASIIALVAWRLFAAVLLFLSGLSVFQTSSTAQAIKSAEFLPQIPRMWDDAAVAVLEVPLTYPGGSPKHVSAEYYYKIPVRPIYRSYPIYAPGRGPAGYLEWLKQQEPEILWDDGLHRPPLQTESNWRKAGELVFDSPLFYDQIVNLDEAQDPEWYKRVNPPLTRDGAITLAVYTIRKRGQVEVGGFGCFTCHTRVMLDGTVVKGAQGNSPVEEAEANRFRYRLAPPALHGLMRIFAVPWLNPDPNAKLGTMSGKEVASVYDRIPPGVVARGRTSPFFPVQIPDIIGVKERHYLDHTGLQLNRDIADIMRYSALNQGIDDLASYDGFIPRGDPRTGERAAPSAISRNTDDHLYALALYLYSLQPPPNPNKFDDAAERGKKVFEREGCKGCHPPPQYTNNNLTLAEGFTPTAEDRRRYDITPVSVGTDPTLALMTRRGTGFYKVPSLKGIWYRSMFGHGGWCASIEDWFDPRRLRDDYIPTGFKPFGEVPTPVKGHQFGVNLSPDDRRALIGFLKTL